MIRYIPRCQWCGRAGTTSTGNHGQPPRTIRRVPGKCSVHPSGKPNMEHSAKWELLSSDEAVTNKIAHIRYIPRCQWCGRTGATTGGGNGVPRITPRVPGYCSVHPSGKLQMPHSSKWKKI